MARIRLSIEINTNNKSCVVLFLNKNRNTFVCVCALIWISCHNNLYFIILIFADILNDFTPKTSIPIRVHVKQTNEQQKNK